MPTKKTVRVDGNYLNAFNTFGRSRMQNFGADLMRGNYYLDQSILQASYMHNGYAKKLCDKPAEEMMRAGFTFENLSEERNKQIQAKLEELQWNKKITDALKWSRAFGGALVVMGLKDGGELNQPVDENAVEDVEFLRTYDKYEATPETYYEDIYNPKFGQIETWQISPKGENTTVGSYIVHETRCLIFDGESVPNDVRRSNQGWGSSVIQTCFVQLMRMDGSYKWANLLLERMQQAVHKVPNLSQFLENDRSTQDFVKRLQIVDSVRSSQNTIAIDGAEEYLITSLSLSGVPDVLDRFAEALCAVSNIPMFVFMGKNIGGLNNGDANKEEWVCTVVGWQNNILKGPIDKVVRYINLEDSDSTTDGGDYTIKFNPLYPLSAMQESEKKAKDAETDYKQMQTLTGYANAQIMDQDEAREIIREKYELQGDAPEPVEPEDPTKNNVVLNPGQQIVQNAPGQKNPLPKNAPAKKASKK